jgi:hypothetical protein
MDVQYEELVEDIEGVSRSVLQHCGLQWEDGCRNFHDTTRTVRTASLMQVRKPLYRSSIGSWRRYAKHLTPLADALGQSGEDCRRSRRENKTASGQGTHSVMPPIRLTQGLPRKIGAFRQ